MVCFLSEAPGCAGCSTPANGTNYCYRPTHKRETGVQTKILPSSLSSSYIVMSSSHPGIVKHHDEMVAAMAKIESSDPSVVIQGMNTLSKKSFEALETNSVHFENYPQLAISLGSLLEVVNPLTSFLFSCGDTGSSSSEYTAGAWPVTLPCQGNPHIKVNSLHVLCIIKPRISLVLVVFFNRHLLSASTTTQFY